MPRHFGPHNMKNGYAAMGGNKRRPIYKGVGNRSLSEAIAAEQKKAAREARMRQGKKK